MKAIQVFEVLRKPLITEKGTALQAQGKYLFEVAAGANKAQVKEAVEKAFKVKVIGVNMMIVKGKVRRAGRGTTVTPDVKKAIVTLKSGDKIQLFEGV
ncbi:MAG: 50S ribosomal protein L23 [Dehalococcoidia bacterium]|nr:50S ribosomal protein L23 [Dehalococcoidia bacterium]